MTQQPDNAHVAGWYDEYTKRQTKIGVNLRHREIIHQLKKNGLQPNHTVLEIGCGIGTLTSLLAKHVSRGKVVAADISPESVATGKKLLAAQKNIEWVVSDMSDFKRSEKFDFVVLPDVMEHIPQENHAALFKTLFAHSTPQTVVYINIPHPKASAYNTIYRPEGQQVIDQALSSKDLLADAYAAGFYVKELVSYALWEAPFDYQRIVFLVDKPLDKLVKLPKNTIRLKMLLRKYFG